MTPKIPMDERSLRERLYQIAEELDDAELKEAVKYRMFSIADGITRSKNYEKIIERLFEDFPISDNIINILKSYQGLEGNKQVIGIIERIFYFREGPEAVKGVVEALGDKTVLKVIKAYQGSERIERVASDIGETAYWTKNPKNVRRVAEDYLKKLENLHE